MKGIIARQMLQTCNLCQGFGHDHGTNNLPPIKGGKKTYGTAQVLQQSGVNDELVDRDDRVASKPGTRCPLSDMVCKLGPGPEKALLREHNTNFQTAYRALSTYVAPQGIASVGKGTHLRSWHFTP